MIYFDKRNLYNYELLELVFLSLSLQCMGAFASSVLNTQMSNCLWNDMDNAHKYHLANWESIAMCKEFERPGIPNLSDLNLCLLAFWLKRSNKDRDKL
jgi:hypothetical protein